MRTLFKGGWTFDGDTLREGLAVVVEGDRIAAVVPVGDTVDAAPDCRVVDTVGATLMPGLIDCHVHILYGAEGNPGAVVEALSPAQAAVRGLEFARATLEGGITAIRDCGGREYIEFAIRDACNTGRFLGPTIRAAGRLICMTGGHGNRFGRVADGRDEVIRAVREQIHAGSDLIKIMATGGVMTPGVNPEDAHYTFEEISAGIAEGHRFNKPCASHAQGTEGILNAVRGGVDSIEHGIFLTDTCVSEMVDAGTYLVPTLAALFNILEHPDKVPSYVIEKTSRMADRHKESIQMFHAAGGKIALGTDAGTPFNRHGENAQELRFMAEVGLGTVDALRAGTSVAADLMRLADHGRIRAGGAADLLLVEGNPTADIRRAADRRHHRLVMKNGVPVTGSLAAPDLLSFSAAAD